jgi:hypothetical protein
MEVVMMVEMVEMVMVMPSCATTVPHGRAAIPMTAWPLPASVVREVTSMPVADMRTAYVSKVRTAHSREVSTTHASGEVGTAHPAEVSTTHPAHAAVTGFGLIDNGRSK